MDKRRQSRTGRCSVVVLSVSRACYLPVVRRRAPRACRGLGRKIATDQTAEVVMIDLARLSDRDKQTIADVLALGYRQATSLEARVQARRNGQVRDLEIVAKLVNALRTSKVGSFSASPVNDVFLLSELNARSIRNECLSRRALTNRVQSAYQLGHGGIRQTTQGVWLIDRLTAKDLLDDRYSAIPRPSSKVP